MAKRTAARAKQQRHAASDRPAPGRRATALWLLPALGVALALVVVAAVLHQHQSRPGASAAAGGPIPEDIARDLSGIPAGTWDRIGAADTARPQLAGPPSAAAPPVVLYIGAEFCPNCAAMRWSLVAALDRFGVFTGLALSASSATDTFPRTPTLTMLHARYQSPYLALEAVELQGNVQDASGQYPPLERLTPSQETLYRRYDPAGYIPFLLVGGRYVLIGSSFSPGLLQGMDWRAVAAGLPLGASPSARAILAAGNEIAAAVCAVDGGAPAAVCRSAGVRDASRTLPAPGK